MPGTTPIFGFRYLELGDPPDIPKVGKDLATDVEAVADDINTRLFSAEAKIAAAAGQGEEPTDQLGFTNTTYAFGTPQCFRTFIAPPSGKVQVAVYMQYRMNTSNTFFGSFEVRTGTGTGGTLVYGPSDEDALRIATSGILLGASTGPHLVTGLVAGNQYTAWTKHKVAAGNGDILHRKILVVPILT